MSVVEPEARGRDEDGPVGGVGGVGGGGKEEDEEGEGEEGGEFHGCGGWGRCRGLKGGED